MDGTVWPPPSLRLPRNRRKYERILSYLRSLAQVSSASSAARNRGRTALAHPASRGRPGTFRPPRAEAERLARIEFGGRDRFEEECQESLGGNRMETFVQDLRFSLRVLRKSPGFTVAAIVTLALAIGANAVVFGVMDSLVLRPLNVPQPESL